MTVAPGHCLHLRVGHAGGVGHDGRRVAAARTGGERAYEFNYVTFLHDRSNPSDRESVSIRSDYGDRRGGARPYGPYFLTERAIVVRRAEVNGRQCVAHARAPRRFLDPARNAASPMGRSVSATTGRLYS